MMNDELGRPISFLDEEVIGNDINKNVTTTWTIPDVSQLGCVYTSPVAADGEIDHGTIRLIEYDESPTQISHEFFTRDEDSIGWDSEQEAMAWIETVARFLEERKLAIEALNLQGR